jgi:hypothetical protein
MLEDLEMMLDHTSDLMGDLHEAVNADLSNIALSITDIGALDSLNNFNYFPILLARSAAMGVTMESVTSRGYVPSAENKRIEDGIKAMNSKISQDLLLAQQEEKRVASEISARQARLSMEHELDEAILAGKQARLAAEQDFYQKQQECEEELERRRVRAQLEYHQLVNDESLRVLKGLKDIGADVTKLLCESGIANATTLNSAARAEVSRNQQTIGRDALIATSPVLNDWFSVPTSNPHSEKELKKK